MKTLPSILVAVLVAGHATPSVAQLMVHDPTNYGSLIQQATTALNQLNELRTQVAEAKRLYDGFNSASGAGALAKILDTPQLRAFVPDIDAYVAAAKGDLAALGDIGRKAAEIRNGARLYTAPADDLASARSSNGPATGPRGTSHSARRPPALAPRAWPASAKSRPPWTEPPTCAP